MGRKTLKLLVVLSLFWLVLTACASKNPNEHTLGNTKGNLNNKSYYAEKDGWIYFTDLMNGSKLSKMREGMEQVIKLNDELSTNINVVGDWVYYINQEQYIYRVKTDGSDKQKIGDVKTSYWSNLIVENETVYFISSEEGNRLYRINSDGSGLKRLNNSITVKFTIEGDWVFYSKIKTLFSEDIPEVEIRKVYKNGASDTLIISGGGFNLIAHEGWLYYTTLNNNNRLYRVRYDGKDNTRISDDEVSQLNLSGNRLVYSTTTEGVLISCEFDGRESHVLTSAANAGEIVGIIGEWIYFMRSDLGGRTFRMKVDGSGMQKAYTLKTIEPNPAGTPIVKGLGAINANLVSGSRFVQKGEWIYYNEAQIDTKMHSIKVDGTQESVLSDLSVNYLNTIGDWLYFVEYSRYSGSIVRMKTDGSQIGIIHDNPINELIVRDEWIYFTDSSNQSNIYKIKIDGTELTKIGDETAIGLNLSGDWIIYSHELSYEEPMGKDEPENSGIFKIKTDGTQKSTVTSDIFTSYIVDGDWVYYTSSQYQDPRMIKKVKLDGSQESVIAKTAAKLYGVYQGWLYYSDVTIEGFERIRTDGTKHEHIYGPLSFYWVYFLNDKIVFFDTYEGKYKIMNPDGSGITDFPA